MGSGHCKVRQALFSGMGTVFQNGHCFLGWALFSRIDVAFQKGTCFLETHVLCQDIVLSKSPCFQEEREEERERGLCVCVKNTLVKLGVFFVLLLALYCQTLLSWKSNLQFASACNLKNLKTFTCSMYIQYSPITSAVCQRLVEYLGGEQARNNNALQKSVPSPLLKVFPEVWCILTFGLLSSKLLRCMHLFANHNFHASAPPAMNCPFGSISFSFQN